MFKNKNIKILYIKLYLFLSKLDTLFEIFLLKIIQKIRKYKNTKK